MLNSENISVIRARVLTRMPAGERRPGPSRWAEANGFRGTVGSFIEGPCFDDVGNLYVVDIPYGRIFKISKDLRWECIFEDDGWPNGLALSADGKLWIADYKKGIRRFDLNRRCMESVLEEHNSEAFKGVNDLIFDKTGSLYFTDQGQTGLQDPSGRVYQLEQDGHINMILNNGPSPNGLVISDEGTLYVAMTRANQVWRGPIQPDGTWTKVCAFQTFYGVAGPDGLALDPYRRLLVAHPGLGCLFIIEKDGSVMQMVKGPTEGAIITNVAVSPGGKRIVMTDSKHGVILEAQLPVPTAGAAVTPKGDMAHVVDSDI